MVLLEKLLLLSVFFFHLILPFWPMKCSLKILTSCLEVGEGKDSESGSKRSTKKVVEYCYEAGMEEVVQFFLFSLLVSFGANVN